MGIFGKKRNDDFSEFHNENLFNDDDDILMPANRQRSHNVGQNGAVAPHAITADELSGTQHIESIPMERPKPDSVYKRMMEREQRIQEEKALDDTYVPSWASSVDDIKKSAMSENQKTKALETDAPKTVEREAVHTVVTPKQAETSNDDFLERCRIAVQQASNEAPAVKSEPIKLFEAEKAPEPEKVTNPVTGESKSRSVDEIIQMLRGKAEADLSVLAPIEEKPQSNSTVTAAVKEDSSANPQLNVEVIPMDGSSDIMHTTSARSVESDVRVYGKIVKGSVVQQTPDGDVEGSDFVKSVSAVTQDTIVAEEKTIMFGELGDIISQKAEADMNNSLHGFEDEDYDSYDDEYEDLPYYEKEDPLLEGIEDYKNLDDAAKLRVNLSSEKTRQKTLSVFSVVAFVLMLIIGTPLTKALPNTTVALIELVLLSATVLVNFDIFKDFKNLFKMRPRFDSAVAIASIVGVAQSAVSAFAYNGQYKGFAIGAVLLLAANRIASLLKSSRILKGLELIANSDKKRAVVSIEGNNAKTISSGSVDGEALLLCDRPATNIKNYLKSCGYFSPFDLKVKILLLCAVLISAVVGIIVGAFGGVGLGLTVASALLSCLFPAVCSFICELPMYFASKKSADLGAVLAGYKGAYELNLANLVAVSSSDLFPEGSVKLYNMKTLAENEIGKTLMDAASVAIAANSPLSAIFTGIIGNVDKRQLPKVNGVQYEDKMGISGWIGERTILIGNRNLMQGHNVTVPPASVDQKILRAGYFPVYIAVGGVPCLLFIVEYETDKNVAYELQTLCNTGMTVVVDPKDPNTSDAMICDYFGLPNDALRVMNHNGRVSYEYTTRETESASASAAFGKDICGFFSTVSSSIKLNATYRILTAIMVIAIVLSAVALGYLALTSKLSFINTLTVAGFQLLFTVVSAIVAKVRS